MAPEIKINVLTQPKTGTEDKVNVLTLVMIMQDSESSVSPMYSLDRAPMITHSSKIPVKHPHTSSLTCHVIDHTYGAQTHMCQPGKRRATITFKRWSSHQDQRSSTTLTR